MKVLTPPSNVYNIKSNAEVVFEVFKLLSAKWFGEDVVKLLISQPVDEVNFTLLDMFSDTMVMDLNVLSLCMKYRILSYFDHTLIVTI